MLMSASLKGDAIEGALVTGACKQIARHRAALCCAICWLTLSRLCEGGDAEPPPLGSSDVREGGITRRRGKISSLENAKGHRLGNRVAALQECHGVAVEGWCCCQGRLRTSAARPPTPRAVPPHPPPPSLQTRPFLTLKPDLA